MHLRGYESNTKIDENVRRELIIRKSSELMPYQIAYVLEDMRVMRVNRGKNTRGGRRREVGVGVEMKHLDIPYRLCLSYRSNETLPGQAKSSTRSTRVKCKQFGGVAARDQL